MNTDSSLCVTLRGGGTISSEEFLRWKSASTNIAFMSTSDMSSAAAPSTRHPCDERSDMICCSRTQPVACYSVSVTAWLYRELVEGEHPVPGNVVLVKQNLHLNTDSHEETSRQTLNILSRLDR